MLPNRLRMKSGIHIGDCQIKPGVPLNNLRWFGQYIDEKKPDIVVNAGDFIDMVSLSVWIRGKLAAEGNRVIDDLRCCAFGLSLLHHEWGKFDVITEGNHEDRIDRAIEASPELFELISRDDLNYAKYYKHVVPFKEQITLHGISYSHFFSRPNSPYPIGGTMQNQVRQIGYSYAAGHSPGWNYIGEHLRNGTSRCGLVNGAAYIHTEDYKRGQNSRHFRGITVLNEMDGRGGFLPMPVSCEYLCRRYEGMTLKQFAKRKKKWIVYGELNPDAMEWTEYE